MPSSCCPTLCHTLCILHTVHTLCVLCISCLACNFTLCSALVVLVALPAETPKQIRPHAAPHLLSSYKSISSILSTVFLSNCHVYFCIFQLYFNKINPPTCQPFFFLHTKISLPFYQPYFLPIIICSQKEIVEWIKTKSEKLLILDPSSSIPEVQECWQKKRPCWCVHDKQWQHASKANTKKKLSQGNIALILCQGNIA